jgi:glucosamine-6-phosphate deaminase
MPHCPMPQCPNLTAPRPVGQTGAPTTVRIRIFDDKLALGKAAALEAARAIENAVGARGRARVIAATGASQFEFLDALTSVADVPWSKVELFHLDEYIGLPETHPASFRRYLKERLIDKVGIRTTHLLDVEQAPEAVCRKVGLRMAVAPIDLAFVGIGENGHLAFNDPPADFHTDEAYLVVTLDEACRRQQVGEGWFARLEDVPTRAVSMSVPQILKADQILCIAPDERKAEAVRASVEGPITNMVPASALQQHPRTTLYLDRGSALRLRLDTITAHQPLGDRAP